MSSAQSEADPPRLSDTSYVVLGLVEKLQPATPYDLKRFAEISVFHFWTVPHTQLYSECGRLAGLGLLDEEREQTGRRRRIYRLTAEGKAALDGWRQRPPDEGKFEIRDPGLIKLFFGADPKMLAAAEVESCRELLATFEQLMEATGAEMPRGMRLALDAGIGHTRQYLEFWSGLAERG